MGILYYLFHGVCHQLPARALSAGGFSMPCCARCAGMYAGLFLGFAVFMPRGRRRRGMPGWGFNAAALAVAALFTTDAAANFIGLWDSAAAMRFALGAMAGLFLSPFIVRLFYSTFEDIESGDAIGGGASAALIFAASGVVYLANAAPAKTVIVIESWAAGAGLLALLGVAHFSILQLVFSGRRPAVAAALATMSVAGQLALFSLLRSLVGALEPGRLTAAGL